MEQPHRKVLQRHSSGAAGQTLVHMRMAEHREYVVKEVNPPRQSITDQQITHARKRGDEIRAMRCQPYEALQDLPEHEEWSVSFGARAPREHLNEIAF